MKRRLAGVIIIVIIFLITAWRFSGNLSWFQLRSALDERRVVKITVPFRDVPGEKTIEREDKDKIVRTIHDAKFVKSNDDLQGATPLDGFVLHLNNGQKILVNHLGGRQYEVSETEGTTKHIIVECNEVISY